MCPIKRKEMTHSLRLGKKSFLFSKERERKQAAPAASGTSQPPSEHPASPHSKKTCMLEGAIESQLEHASILETLDGWPYEGKKNSLFISPVGIGACVFLLQKAKLV